MSDISLNVLYDDSRGVDHDWPAVVAAMLGLIFSLGTISISAFGVFMRPLHAEFGWNRMELSGAVTCAQFAGILGAPIWGAFVDRLGPRPAVLVSITMMSLLSGALSLLNAHLAYLYLAYAAFPLLSGGNSPLGFSATLMRRFERHLGLALGLSAMGLGLGVVVVPMLAQALVEAFGWRQAYALIGVLTFLIGVPATLVATRHTHGPVPRRFKEPSLRLLPILGSRTFFLICVVLFLLGLMVIGVFSQLIPMMTDRGFTPTSATGILAIAGATSIISQGGTGWLLDRVNAPRMVALTGLLVGVAVLLLAVDRGGPSSYLAAVLLGGTLGAEANYLPYLIRRHFDPAAFGRLSGIGFGVLLLGGGFGPLIMGASFDHFGNYRPALLLFFALAILSAAFALAIPKHKKIGI